MKHNNIFEKRKEEKISLKAIKDEIDVYKMMMRKCYLFHFLSRFHLSSVSSISSLFF